MLRFKSPIFLFLLMGIIWNQTMIFIVHLVDNTTVLQIIAIPIERLWDRWLLYPKKKVCMLPLLFPFIHFFFRLTELGSF